VALQESLAELKKQLVPITILIKKEMNYISVQNIDSLSHWVKQALKIKKKAT
jgi:hypothetical protein